MPQEWCHKSVVIANKNGAKWFAIKTKLALAMNSKHAQFKKIIATTPPIIASLHVTEKKNKKKGIYPV